MATLEYMVVQPVKLGTAKPINAIKAIISKIEIHHIFGMMYVLIALSMAVSEQEGVMRWAFDQIGIRADVPATLFALCALIFLFKPGRIAFAICLIPLIPYLCFLTLFAISSSRLSLTTTWMVIALMGFMWILQFKRLWRFDIRHVYSVASMILGITILLHPDRGTAAWLHERWVWMPTELFGLVLVFSSCLIPIGGKSVNTFISGISPLVLYAFASLIFSLTTAGLVAGAVTFLTLVCVVWASLKATDYLEVV